MAYWIIKSEPNKYPWGKLLEDEWTYWDGVRNYQARNNLRDMKKGDKLLFYHSNIGKEIVGIAEVIKESYQDPTTDDNRWLAVDIKPIAEMQQPVTLVDMKSNPNLEKLPLIKQSRLSVSPLSPAEYREILKMGKTKLPK